MNVSYDDLRSKLEEQRQQLLAELAEKDTRLEEGHGYSTHQADDATEAFDQAADLAIRRNAERMLYDVERALTRLEDGTYGICKKCGKPIDHARLKAIPYTRYCVDCANLVQAT